jgi:hypothetical protein
VGNLGRDGEVINRRRVDLALGARKFFVWNLAGRGVEVGMRAVGSRWDGGWRFDFAGVTRIAIRGW